MTSRLEQLVTTLSSSVWLNDDDNDVLLSYRQLIPIHEALIVASSSSTNDNGTVNAASSNSSSSNDHDTTTVLSSSLFLKEGLTVVIEENNNNNNYSFKDHDDENDIINATTNNHYNPFQWIDDSFSADEREFMIQILNNDNNTNKIVKKEKKLYRLFFIQYLCHFLLLQQKSNMKKNYNGIMAILFERFNKIVIPLVRHSKMMKDDNDDGNDDDDNEEFREAFLDIVFRCDPNNLLDNDDDYNDQNYLNNNDNEEVEAKLLGLLQKELGLSTSAAFTITNSFSWACRIVVRFMEFWKEQQQKQHEQQQSNRLVQIEEKLVLPLILHGMQQTKTLSPVIRWLLPLSLSADDDIQITMSTLLECVWNECLQLMSLIFLEEDSTTKKEEEEATCIVSAVLCTILPKLLSIQLPSGTVAAAGTAAGTSITMNNEYCYNHTEDFFEQQRQNNSNANDEKQTNIDNDIKKLEGQRRQPLLQPMIWKFILHSLHRGNFMYITLTKGGTFHFDTASKDPILRRRGLYLLRQLLSNNNDDIPQSSLLLWMKYVLCFETLEMEFEPHLIDQVWDTVAELCINATTVDATVDENDDGFSLSMSWKWISALLGRILVSDTPVLRKLGLYRFLNGEAGIQMTAPISKQTSTSTPKQDDDEELCLLKQFLQRQPQKKKMSIPSSKLKITNSNSGDIVGAPLSLVSAEFILKAIIPSFDTVSSSVGTIMNYECQGKIETQDFTCKFEDFIVAWVQQQQQEQSNTTINCELVSFMKGILSYRSIGFLRPKTTILLLSSIVRGLSSSSSSHPSSFIVMNEEDYESILCNAVQSFQKVFNEKQVVITYRQSMLRDFAILLSFLSFTATTNSTSQRRRQLRIKPETILCVLSLYNNPDLLLMHPSSIASSSSSSTKGKQGINITTRSALRQWVQTLQEKEDNDNKNEKYHHNKNSSSSPSSMNWIFRLVRDCATSFVQLELVAPMLKVWDPIAPSNKSERTMANSIVLLSSLLLLDDSKRTSNNDKHNMNKTDHISSLLWPAIYIGLIMNNDDDNNNDKTNKLVGSESFSFAPFRNNNTSAMTEEWAIARKTHRAILLLQNACMMKIFHPRSKKTVVTITDIMMTAAAAVAVKSLRNHIEALFFPQTVHDSGCSPTSITSEVAVTYAGIISQLRVFGQFFYYSLPEIDPEHLVAIQKMIKSAVHVIRKKKQPIINIANDYDGTVLSISLMHSALSLSAPQGTNNGYDENDRLSLVLFPTFDDNHGIILDLCIKLLQLKFGLRTSSPSTQVKEKKEEEEEHRKYAAPTVLSLFHYARWECLSILIPKLLCGPTSQQPQDAALINVCEQIFAAAHDVVEITPTDALLPLFDTLCIAARYWFSFHQCCHGDDTVDNYDNNEYPIHLRRIQESLFSALMDMAVSNSYVYMLNKLCALLFQSPMLLCDEYQRLEIDSEYPSPIRQAFFTLVKKSGIHRSHLLQAAMAHICAGWLGISSYTNDTTTITPVAISGVGAIPYRDGIVKLLVYKELKRNISSIKRSILLSNSSGDSTKTTESKALLLPPNTDEASFTRGYLLVFLSRLPGPGDDDFNQTVLDQFIYPMILKLIGKEYCFAPVKSSSGNIMCGTPEYSLRIRSWQALCVLSRFLKTASENETILGRVCDAVFRALEPNLHCEIRYFIEIFAIQLARQHPHMFMKRYIEKEICRTNLSPQHISSLMIIGGYLVVGKYRLKQLFDFTLSSKSSSYIYDDTQNEEKDHCCEPPALHHMLRGIIPWLSSTQGFSRALAQFTVHSLIPLVIDVSSTMDNNNKRTNWYLWNLFQFLDKNPEMKRLQEKQTHLFQRYDVDNVCTAEGILSIPVDESDEAKPEYVVDFIKRCLEEVYLESHAKEAPEWKQRLEHEQQQQEKKDVPVSYDNIKCDEDNADALLTNFQRKIIPFHALDLAMNDTTVNHRQKQKTPRHNNNTITQKSLIVCGSLIDQIPTLAGLARTAEIFAADQLIIPDLKVIKMDNFKSISVTAGDWIPIEECKEENLIPWLQEKQREGYTIVGMEQTPPSSNMITSVSSMNKFQFPKRAVLLLGKEKKGLPILFHPYIDWFIPILPHQVGITRCLNEHISGAICIWEYAKQQQQPE